MCLLRGYSSWTFSDLDIHVYKCRYQFLYSSARNSAAVGTPETEWISTRLAGPCPFTKKIINLTDHMKLSPGNNSIVSTSTPS